MVGSKIVSPGLNNSVITDKGEKLTPPSTWSFLPAGDAGITRKVTAKGNYWRVQIKKGRRTMSLGLWAPTSVINQAKIEVSQMRSSDNYEKKQAYNLKRRNQKQDEYEIEFNAEVEKFLSFHSIHLNTQKLMARAITKHAIPIGSGTVARTAMIPIEQRAAKAVIAWMRHQTTGYDHLVIPKIKGERRAVRRLLAEQSIKLLFKYRSGEVIDERCPLLKAILKLE